MTNIQWTTSDNQTFFPVGKTVDLLPSGCYQIKESMQGLFFVKQDIRDNSLVSLPDSNASKVLEEINKFWESKQKFEEHKMPYKRGLLLYGPPGSGKTSALRTAMENVMSRDGIVLEYESPHTFLEGYKIIRQIHKDRPIISLMEDLDSKLGYDQTALLQLLDGVHDMNNIMFIATTNYPENLGSRIFNRPSRFDKKFFIGMPSAESRRTYLQHKGIEENIEKWVKDTDGLSIAHLAELYTAVKVFEDDYSEAVKVIKSMESIPHSSLFDKSNVDSSPEAVGQCYYEHKAKLKNGSKVLSESKSKKKLIKENKIFGNIIKSNKKTDTKNINSKSTIDQIADMM